VYVPTENGDGLQLIAPPPSDQVAGSPDPSSVDEPAAVSSVELAPETTTTTTTTTAPPSTEPPPTTTTTTPPPPAP
jgi:hypothetical protein